MGMRTHVAAIIAVVAITTVGCGGATEPPDVAGKELSFARGAMEASGLDYDVAYETTDEVDPGTVLRVDDGDDGQPVLVVAERPMRTITGTFSLVDSGVREVGTGCYGSGGYDDVQEGMNVTVRDGDGNIIATGTTVNSRKDGPVTCVMDLEVADVPVVDFYEIEVGRRGALSYSYDDLDANGFEVAFVLS